jgi:hypothetical protein
MPVTDIPSPTSYIDAREFYQKAFYRHKNFTDELMLRLGVSSFSELEDHLLRHRGELYERGQPGRSWSASWSRRGAPPPRHQAPAGEEWQRSAKLALDHEFSYC